MIEQSPLLNRGHTTVRSKRRPAIYTRTFVAVVACGLNTGCVPVNEQYQRVEVADAVYLQGLCGGSGPPDWTYYPFHGIFISVSLTPLQLGLHYTVGTTVTLDGDAATINGWRKSEPIQLTAHLTPAIHAALGNGVPEEFDAMTDPMDPGRRSGYHRSSKGSDLVWANFIARDAHAPNRIFPMPRDLERTKILIPPITINGQKYEPQELSIIRKKYTGIIPINC
jgi:hypothetical protein